jgi:hypothetical protein
MGEMTSYDMVSDPRRELRGEESEEKKRKREREKNTFNWGVDEERKWFSYLVWKP